jgi:hypothetical protein
MASWTLPSLSVSALLAACLAAALVGYGIYTALLHDGQLRRLLDQRRCALLAQPGQPVASLATAWPWLEPQPFQSELLLQDPSGPVLLRRNQEGWWAWRLDEALP